MNAVEIEEAVSALAERRSTPPSFPSPSSRPSATRRRPSSACATARRTRRTSRRRAPAQQHPYRGLPRPARSTKTLAALRASPKTAAAKAKFILATDGETFEAEDLDVGETVACAYADFPDHFGFFLPLAGITTVKQIRENAFDIRATGRLNRLYIELLKENPEWGTRRAPARHEPLHGAADLLLLRRETPTSSSATACSPRRSSR